MIMEKGGFKTSLFILLFLFQLVCNLLFPCDPWWLRN